MTKFCLRQKKYFSFCSQLESIPSLFPYTVMHGTVSLKQLIEKYGMSSDQLDCEIEDEDMIILANHFDDVEYYLSILGLSAAEQADVRNKATKGTQIAMNHCLLLWKQHTPSTATLRTLLEILLSMKKGEIASKLCKYYYPTNK